MTKIRFDDAPFRASHGKAPRGRGHWWFATHRCFADGEGRTYHSGGTLTEAKRDAARQLRADNAHREYDTLYVMP